jgi:nucleoside-diphosphate-sugar epimerase
VSVAVIVAVGVNTDGQREVLGLKVGASEAEPIWTEFLRSLNRRGLRGVKLVISDSHEGIKAATAKVLKATSLKELHTQIATALCDLKPALEVVPPRFAEFRAGDVRHSLADIGKAHDRLGYVPTHSVQQGLAEALPWYIANATRQTSTVR